MLDDFFDHFTNYHLLPCIDFVLFSAEIMRAWGVIYRGLKKNRTFWSYSISRLSNNLWIFNGIRNSIDRLPQTHIHRFVWRQYVCFLLFGISRNLTTSSHSAFFGTYLPGRVVPLHYAILSVRKIVIIRQMMAITPTCCNSDYALRCQFLV